MIYRIKHAQNAWQRPWAKPNGQELETSVDQWSIILSGAIETDIHDTDP